MKQSKIIALTILLAFGLTKPNQAAPKQKAAEISKVFIIGKVKKPGAYNFSAKWRLLDAIAVSGGVTANPNSLRVSILRSGKKLLVNLPELFASDSSQNLPLQPGDAVIVDAAESLVESTVPPEWLNPHPQGEQKGFRDKGQFEFNGITVRIVPLTKKGTAQKQK